MDLEDLKGRAWIFGDNVDTDQIIQGRYLTLLDYTEMAKHAFEIPRPEFVSDAKEGDFIVAGSNFGGGSSREEAPMVIKELGISCVIAESFARIFYRNAFNVGLPLMVVPDVTNQVSEGDILTINLIEGTLRVNDKDTFLRGDRLPEFMKSILDAGGAVGWYRSQKD